ncbi:uncharacterized protein EI90DRAFT_779236 [Cantharellus anzutake]|uniref:uncharacterized protein n=1 Tax=Cantharellus anzutake TaxID=1750568 RepID=UPI001904035F|nr:uncharacterized protein EI90DRAFT_779236 [Cantharellus anzutake]KAF8342732.1 hypothetical protein EI90DRAFT_779236 [Cantharellus anzutake]
MRDWGTTMNTAYSAQVTCQYPRPRRLPRGLLSEYPPVCQEPAMLCFASFTDLNPTQQGRNIQLLFGSRNTRRHDQRPSKKGFMEPPANLHERAGRLEISGSRNPPSANSSCNPPWARHYGNLACQPNAKPGPSPYNQSLGAHVCEDAHDSASIHAH